MTEDKTVAPRYVVPTLDETIAAHLAYVLELYAWNMSASARALDVDRRTLYRMVERLHVQRTEVPPVPAEQGGAQ